MGFLESQKNLKRYVMIGLSDSTGIVIPVWFLLLRKDFYESR